MKATGLGVFEVIDDGKLIIAGNIITLEVLRKRLQSQRQSWIL